MIYPIGEIMRVSLSLKVIDLCVTYIKPEESISEETDKLSVISGSGCQHNNQQEGLSVGLLPANILVNLSVKASAIV